VWLRTRSHTLTGLIVWGVPAAIVTATMLRWRVAEGVLRQVPDTRFELHRWAAVAAGRHPWWRTVISAALGVASHQVIDGFTHTGRWGAEWLGWSEVIFSVPLRGDFTWASVAQYVGHTLGSVVAIWLIVRMTREGWVERRYGADVVAAARRRVATVTTPDRVLFWLVFVGIMLTTWAGALVLGRSIVFWTVTNSWLALLVAGSLRLDDLPASARRRVPGLI